MNCAEARTLLDADMDGELSIGRSLELERHLKECPSCQAELASRRALGTGLREKLDYHRAPLSLHRALRNELGHADAASVAVASAVRPMPASMLMAAALILVAGFSAAGTYYGTSSSGDVIPVEGFGSHFRGVQSGDALA